MVFLHDKGGRNHAHAMPTAARLIGALWFFLVAWCVAIQVLATFPPGTPATYFPLSLGLIAACRGWVFGGRGVGQGRGIAIGYGVTCAAQIAFLGLLVFAMRAVYLRALNNRYDGLADALDAVAMQFLAYADQSLTLPIWGVLLAGGVIGGLICETVAKRWR